MPWLEPIRGKVLDGSDSRTDPRMGSRGTGVAHFTFGGAKSSRGDTDDAGETPSSVVVSRDVEPLPGGNGVPVSGVPA